MRSAVKSGLLLLAAHYACFLQNALACSRIYGPPVKVKTAFVVVVRDPVGNPIPNAEVRAYELIRKSGDVPAHVELAGTAVSGKDGKAAIGLVQDDYTLGASINGVSSEVLQISVYDDGSGVSELSLTWPGGPITKVQNASGKLGLGAGRVPWVGAKVELKGTANKNLGESTTDVDGRFSFPGVPPGFYALRVRNTVPNPDPLPQLEGDIPIEIRKDAPNVELPSWGFAAGSCGLSAYTGQDSMIIFAP